MKVQRIKLLVILTLIVSNAATVMLLLHAHGQRFDWQERLFRQAVAAGTQQAVRDYEAGELRLYELATDATSAFRRADGPFEVWTWPDFDEAGRPFTFSAELFVEAYNARMRDMHQQSVVVATVAGRLRQH